MDDDHGSPPAGQPAPACASADLERLAGELGAVDDVLRRLDEGTHGVCEACGATLDAALLEKDPTAARCRACGPGAARPSPSAG